MTDEDEFYEVVGCRTLLCGNELAIKVLDKDGNTIAQMDVSCSLIVNETGSDDLKCRHCKQFLLPCDCGNGVALSEMTGNTDQMVCTYDGFCKHGNVPADQLESHDEDFSNRAV